MRPVENETRLTMAKRRNFVNYATMTLSDGTVLNLTPSDFRISGNTFTDDWVDGDTFQVGTAIGKTATILLDNTDGRTEIVGSTEVVYPHGKFSEYDFYMAYFTLYVCLPEAYHYNGELRDQMIRIGKFTVTTPVANSATIEITGVDNMYMFDRPFEECQLDFTVSGGVSLMTILLRCCSDCGVAIGFADGFENDDIKINEKPENVSYRQVVSMVATLAGCNACINDTGALVLKWYDLSAFATWWDGGSFTAIGEEFQYMNKITWSSGGATGYNIFYDRVPRSGTYKITRIIISDIEDTDTFDGYYEIDQYNSFRDSVNNGTPFNSSLNRLNQTVLQRANLVEGENEVDFDVEVTALNRINYWMGIGSNSGTGSKFSATIYMEPLSYDDKDSADGGTFEPECLRTTLTWSLTSGTLDGQMRWVSSESRSPDIIGPAGKYVITRLYVDNIADADHFNGKYIIEKSVDNGSTWTFEEDGNLVAGDNIVDFEMDLPDSNLTRYRVKVGQNVSLDPSASTFRTKIYFKANGDTYLDGDVIDGGNFDTQSGYHNLKDIKGTQVHTDDIHFTGVVVSFDESSAHYPASNWEGYVLEVTENPFVKGIEATIAEFLYNKVRMLVYRPYSCQSIQDPTIEAGDSVLVYDVKGNTYPSIVTNTQFTTGGYTEVSAKAQSPVSQNSRYVNSTSRAVAFSERRMTDYNKQVAHFNELASEALGYYRTEEADLQTGATITYIHNQPSLETSTIIWKITGDGIFISEDGGESYNAGYDASTGTMMMNLIYAHGITADWIHTGTLDVGGLNNIDGEIHVANRVQTSSPLTVVDPDTYVYFSVGPSQIRKSGSYKLFYSLSAFESGKPEHVECQIYKRDMWDGSTYTWKLIQSYYPLTSHDGELPGLFEVDTTNGDIYYGIYFSRMSTSNATFTAGLYYNKINTVIDRNGIDTSAINITGGSISITNPNDSTKTFEVTNEGKITATDGEIAGLTINLGECGWQYDGFFGIYYNGSTHNVKHFFKISAYGGISCGRQMDPSNGDWSSSYPGGGWINLDWVQSFAMLKIDIGQSTHGYRGVVVTNAGNNRYYDPGSTYVQMLSNTITKSNGQEVVWGSSDKRLKQNIHDLTLEESKDLIDAVRPRSFEFKSDPGVTRYGFIAQEVREVIDEDSGVEFESEETGFHLVNYNDFIAPLCMIVKDQQRQIDELKAELDQLKSIVNNLK